MFNQLAFNLAGQRKGNALTFNVILCHMFVDYMLDIDLSALKNTIIIRYHPIVWPDSFPIGKITKMYMKTTADIRRALKNEAAVPRDYAFSIQHRDGRWLHEDEIIDTDINNFLRFKPSDKLFHLHIQLYDV